MRYKRLILQAVVSSYKEHSRRLQPNMKSVQIKQMREIKYYLIIGDNLSMILYNIYCTKYLDIIFSESSLN